MKTATDQASCRRPVRSDVDFKEVVKPAGEWNKTEVIANDGKLEILVNDEKVLSTNMWDDNWKKMIAASKFKEWPGFGTLRKAISRYKTTAQMFGSEMLRSKTIRPGLLLDVCDSRHIFGNY